MIELTFEDGSTLVYERADNVMLEAITQVMREHGVGLFDCTFKPA